MIKCIKILYMFKDEYILNLLHFRHSVGFVIH